MALSNEARVILSHGTAVRQVRERLTRYATSKWRGLDAYREQDAERFIAQVVPLIESGQKQVGQLTAAYIQAFFRLHGASPPKMGSIPTYTDLRGIAASEVYRRPFVSIYNALSNGTPFSEALSQGEARLNSLLLTDVQMANVRIAHEGLSAADKVVGYERVLYGADPCPLCVIASTQMYHKADLMPIHPGCQCDVAPVFGSGQPAAFLNEQRYADITSKLEEAGITDTNTGTYGKGGGDYRDLTAIRIREHGEYGPTLTWRDQAFTGSDDI